MDTSEIINEHIGDAHSWHIVTWKGHPVEVHLPVMAWSRHSGWHAFSSARLAEGQTYEGLRLDHHNKLVELMPDGSESRPFDISITKNVSGLFLVSFMLVALVLYCARWYRKHPLQAPKGLVGLVELVVCYLYDNVIDSIIGGRGSVRFAPYLLTAFFFILLCNLVGLIPIFPFGMNLTGNIAVTVTLAAATFLVVNLTGTRHYWKDILWPNVPLFLKFPIPLMQVIEIVGMFTKPFSLTIRLLANIFAGHTIILSLVCMIFTSVSMGVNMHRGMTVVAVTFAVFMNMMELLVAFLQAFVFTTMSASYISQAQVGGHEEEPAPPQPLEAAEPALAEA